MTDKASNRGNKELKCVRQYLGLSLVASANSLANVSKKNWCKWETDYYIPDDIIRKVENLILLRDEYYQKLKNLSFNELLNDIDNNPFDKETDPVNYSVVNSVYNFLIFENVSNRILKGEEVWKIKRK